MLSVRCHPYSGESVALYNTLETLSFRSSDDIHQITFFKHRNGDSIAHLLLEVVITEFVNLLLWCGTCLLEMPLHGLWCILFFSFVKSHLRSIITVDVFCLDLGND